MLLYERYLGRPFASHRDSVSELVGDVMESAVEAQLTNDDGTARDKFTRIIHLVEQSRERVARGERGFEVVACIDGRGFGIRRADMRRLITSLQGKVFTLSTLDDLVGHSGLAAFATRTST